MSATNIIINDETPRRQYVASASQTVFDFPFPVFAAGDIVVYKTPFGNTPNDAADILTLTTDYTVSGADTQASCKVTLNTGATAGDIITIIREVDIERTSDYQVAGDLLAETLNREQDTEVMALQQLRAGLDRSLRLQTSDTTDLPALTALESGQYLRVNETATGFEYAAGTALNAAAQTETQVLASGQTAVVFTASPAVAAFFINGLDADDSRLRSGTDYTVSGNTVTLTESYPAGTELMMVYYEADADIANLYANAIQYTQGGTGSVYRSVENRLRDVVSVKDFGAVGDGVTDDRDAIDAAITAANGKILDGGNSTYRMDSVIASTAENIVIQNMTLDISNIVGGSALSFTGSQGAATNLSVNLTKGNNVVTVADSSGFTANGYAWLSSSAVFETSTSVTLGQVVKVLSVDSATQVTLYDNVLYDFNTSDTAQLAPLSLKSNIHFNNVKFIGADSGTQRAMLFDKCVGVRVSNCSFEYVDYISISLSRCVDSVVDSTSVRYASAVGLAYGISIANGSYNTRVTNGYGEDTRHYVTVGDNDGVNLYVNVSGCNIVAAKEAGIDAHPACDYMSITDNMVKMADTVSGSSVGIIFQGLNCNISNNTVVNAEVFGIFCQHTPKLGTASCVVSNNAITNSGGSVSTDAGIGVYHQGSSITISGVTVTGNVIRGTNDYGIYVYGFSGDIENVTIANNSISSTTSRGIFLNANPTYTIDHAAITGNVCVGSGSEGIYLLGESTINITNATITGNTVDGFTFGLRCVLADEVNESGNTYLNYGDPYEVATNCTNIYLDTSRFGALAVTNSTFALEEHNDWLVCNRAGTITLTFRDAATYPNKEIYVKTVQAQSVISASSNVVPVGGTSAGTAILPATAGAWALLKSDGTNWVIMAEG